MARKNIEIIRLTESDLHKIIENSVKAYLREEKFNEGIGNKFKNATIGTAMAMSPMNGHAATDPNIDNTHKIEQTQVLNHEEIQHVIDVLKQNTRENIKDIKEIERAMAQDSGIADIVYQLAFMDEKDNFVTINPNKIEGIDEDTYNILSQKIEQETLVFMTYINEDQIVRNIIVPIDALEEALSRY